MEIITVIAVIIAMAFGIRWAIRYVRTVTYQTGHGFFSIPFFVLLVSLFIALYVGFTAQEDFWLLIVVTSAIAIAGALNIHKIGLKDGIIFTLLQCLTIYFAVIVAILYTIFKSAKESGAVD